MSVANQLCGNNDDDDDDDGGGGGGGGGEVILCFSQKAQSSVMQVYHKVSLLNTYIHI
jgi:hypothetical protein